jgi:hypothetical protein
LAESRKEDGVEALLYIVEEGLRGTRGEFDGETEKFCWKGVAELSIGPPSM